MPKFRWGSLVLELILVKSEAIAFIICHMAIGTLVLVLIVNEWRIIWSASNRLCLPTLATGDAILKALVWLSDHLWALLLLIGLRALGNVLFLHFLASVSATPIKVRVIYLASVILAVWVVFVAVTFLQDALDYTLSPRTFCSLSACRLLLVSAWVLIALSTIFRALPVSTPCHGPWPTILRLV